MGYDPRAVNIPKSVKLLAASYTDNNQRRAFIKSYVALLGANASRSSKGKKD
jgi:hypothetical protein